MQTLQSLFTKYWIFVVSKKNTYMYTKRQICLGKSEYHNRFFPFALRCTVTFPFLIICWNLWIYMKFDLGPLALLSILFIDVAIVI